jgi:hypothetical protein
MSQNRVFDDFARLVTDASEMAQGVRREAETAMKSQLAPDQTAIVPGYFQFPIVYGNFGPADTVDPELRTPWGAPVRIADMQGGLGSTRMPDGSLAGTTAGAGGDIYRGDRLPKDLLGDYFYGEVVARIVRRFRPVKTEGLTQMRNAYPLSEFMRSTDPLFRPVDIKLGPDGALYIADFYNKIIGHYEVDLKHPGRDKMRGRIWRIVWTANYGKGPAKSPGDLTKMKREELDKLLGSPNIAVRMQATHTLINRTEKELDQLEKESKDVPARSKYC